MKKVFVFCLATFLASPLLAANDKPARAKNKAESPAKEPLSSEEKGADRTWQVTAGPELFSYLGFGVATAYYLSPASLLTASFRNGSDILMTFATASIDDTIDASTLAFGFRRFVSRKLYLEGSLFFMQLNRSSVKEVSSEEDVRQATLQTEAAGGMLTLGSQWHIGHFTMGCDWIGIGLPVLSSGIKVDRKIEDTYESGLESDKDEFSKKAKTPFPVALRLFFGASF